MDTSFDLTEIKKQVFEFLELSQKTISTKIFSISKELDSLKKENEFIIQKCKAIFDKVECYPESLNNTFLSEVSRITNPKKQELHKRVLTNKSSKISIHNLVINKKVQIGKTFSKLRIGNSITPVKSANTSQNIRKSTSPNESKTSLHQAKIAHARMNFKKKDIINANGAKKKGLNIAKDKVSPENGKTIQKNNIINDIRKFSIIDIPGDIQQKKKEKQSQMIDFIFGKEQKLMYILAKSK